MGETRSLRRQAPRADAVRIVRLSDYLRARPRPALPKDAPRGVILLFTGVMYERRAPDAGGARDAPDEPRRRRR
ncbi:hypothetical protein GCM10011322_27630 [Salinarimonas ramus]|uniref:Uncharacterized protein n=1 Tax=Salinarimonas ramus TaxID=690164 RepID=A0A917V5C8_9HYPH|nr:hypothetical protein GCM10011322_27630 [Salinarimonas ramus]